MTTPIVNGEVRKTSRDDEIYDASRGAATQRASIPRQSLWARALEGAILGVAFWVILVTLGIPWVFHMNAFDGLPASMLLGIAIALTRWRVGLWGLVLVVSVLEIVIGFTPVIVKPVQSHVRSDPMPARADAIVVLAGGTSEDGLILPQATDRLLKGLELLSRGVAPVLVLPREADSVGTRLVTSRDDHYRIVSLVRDAQSKVVFSGLTHSTRDEAVQTEKLFRARGWKRVVLVTSPLHTRRACRTFEKVGIVVSCTPSESREFAINTLRKPEDRVRAFQAWIYEMAGTLRYLQLGWI